VDFLGFAALQHDGLRHYAAFVKSTHAGYFSVAFVPLETFEQKPIQPKDQAWRDLPIGVFG
jgi:hypothetical protein